jgi:Derlin-2/3
MDFGGVGGGANGAVDIMSWYMDIPVVSRLYLTGAFLTTAACAVDIITPFSLYFNWDLIFSQGQVWRLITSYLFFGVFSIDFLFHMYFLVSPGDVSLVLYFSLNSCVLIFLCFNFFFVGSIQPIVRGG